MKTIFLLCAFLSLVACHDKKQTEQNDPATNINRGTTPSTLVSKPIPSDTFITFSFYDLSTEGAEAIVNYINDTITNIQLSICAERGKYDIKYQFLKNGNIKVFEQDYQYRTTFTEVKSASDVRLISAVHYQLDTSAKLLTNIKDNHFTYIYKAIRKEIPTVLSSSSIKRINDYEEKLR